MWQHLRANLTLLVVTVVLCAGVYPLILLGIGQTLFHDKAEGSLIAGKDGKPVGSRLIAQQFKGDEYFQPRPSAVGYNASASGASNYAASNPALRERVVASLGPVLKYRNGTPIGEDVEKWFRATDEARAKAKEPALLLEWANSHPGLVAAWVKDHAEPVALWIGEKADDVKNKPEDVAPRFFERYAAEHRASWPGTTEEKAPDGTPRQVIRPVTKGSEIQSAFFEKWWQANPQADLEPVPADMVMTSGSGLDPHITLANAQYQLDRVAAAWAEKTKRSKDDVRRDIEKLLKDKKEEPLGGLVGVPLVNVLEVNLALEGRLNVQR